MTLRIANAAGFLGDSIDAPHRLVTAAPVDYLTLEYLAELTLSILARKRQKDPQAGFASDFLEVLSSLTSDLLAQPQLKIVTNAGGVNTIACVRAAAKVLVREGLEETLLGIVQGDDLIDNLDAIQANGCDLAHLDTGQPLSELSSPIVSANAYLGARQIAEALDQGARIVIAGRVADASLTVGPAVKEFGWGWSDWNSLAAGSVAGHLIECGAQVTGGYAVDWRDHELADIGYPIAELEREGDCVITKPPGTGGVVDRRTVVEQFVYEIGDPSCYLTPDVEVDFSTVSIDRVGPDRVAVSGATGLPAPEEYKVSLAYHDGYTTSAQLLVFGDDCVEKAHACADLVFSRLRKSGFTFDRTHVELLGMGAAAGTLVDKTFCPRELVLRIAVHHSERKALERFTKEIVPLITSGPAGLAGYTATPTPVRPVFSFWPTLLPKTFVSPSVQVQSATQWLSSE